MHASKFRKTETSKPRNVETLKRRFHRTVTCLAVAAAPLFLSSGGCTSDGYPLDNTYHYQGKAPSAAPLPSTYAYRYPDTPPLLGARDLQEFVGRFRHRVVLLDFWASWSRQAREEMLMLARLQDELEDEGFQVIACNFDAEDKWTDVTVPMLHAAGANFPCVIIPDSQKAALRKWFAPNWSYDLPARFIVDRRGIVAAQALGGTPLAAVEQQVRRYVSGEGGKFAAEVSPAGATVRAKIVSCKDGRADSLPELASDPASPRRLAEQIGQYLTARVDRATNPRIAILPMADAQERRRPIPMGIETADELETYLKEQGYYDVIPPARTLKTLEQCGLSTMSIDYEPGLVKGKLDADFLVIGWLRPPRGSESSALAAGTAAARPEPQVIVKEVSEEP